MTRAIGIDPGTISCDVCGRDADRLFFERSLPIEQLRLHPKLLLDALDEAGPVDLIVGPSGYGLPWVAASDLGPREVDLLLLGDGEGAPRGTIVGGMGRLLQVLKESGSPVCFAPGVIHLTTVPEHRKVNRIDMGTADKLCAVALGVWDQARRLCVPYHETSFIYVELGGAFTAVVAVEGGAIVDGYGGTSGAMGYRSMGAMDGEVAYLLRAFPKDTLATGGVAWVAGVPEAPAEQLIAAEYRDSRVAWDAFFEDVTKRVASEMSILAAPREILLSGRLSRLAEVRRRMTEHLSRFAPVRRVEGYAKVAKEAAQGAALIGQGLVGGELEALVEAMELRDARGSVLDNLYISQAEDVRARHPRQDPPPVPFWERS